ncbi:MAG: hypothetical protein IPG71_10710 [bacterium]|nr:hypothetical protein [bacterium]
MKRTRIQSIIRVFFCFVFSLCLLNGAAWTRPTSDFPIGLLYTPLGAGRPHGIDQISSVYDSAIQNFMGGNPASGYQFIFDSLNVNLGVGDWMTAQHMRDIRRDVPEMRLMPDVVQPESLMLYIWAPYYAYKVGMSDQDFVNHRDRRAEADVSAFVNTLYSQYHHDGIFVPDSAVVTGDEGLVTVSIDPFEQEWMLYADSANGDSAGWLLHPYTNANDDVFPTHGVVWLNPGNSSHMLWRGATWGLNADTTFDPIDFHIRLKAKYLDDSPSDTVCIVWLNMFTVNNLASDTYPRWHSGAGNDCADWSRIETVTHQSMAAWNSSVYPCSEGGNDRGYYVFTKADFDSVENDLRWTSKGTIPMDFGLQRHIEFAIWWPGQNACYIDSLEIYSEHAERLLNLDGQTPTVLSEVTSALRNYWNECGGPGLFLMDEITPNYYRSVQAINQAIGGGIVTNDYGDTNWAKNSTNEVVGSRISTPDRFLPHSQSNLEYEVYNSGQNEFASNDGNARWNWWHTGWPRVHPDYLSELPIGAGTAGFEREYGEMRVDSGDPARLSLQAYWDVGNDNRRFYSYFHGINELDQSTPLGGDRDSLVAFSQIGFGYALAPLQNGRDNMAHHTYPTSIAVGRSGAGGQSIWIVTRVICTKKSLNQCGSVSPESIFALEQKGSSGPPAMLTFAKPQLLGPCNSSCVAPVAIWPRSMQQLTQ